MLSNQVLQKAIKEIKDITGAEVSLWNMKQRCVVETMAVALADKERILSYIQVKPMEGSLILKKLALFGVWEDENPVYVLAIHGLEHEAQVVGRLCVSQLENLLIAYRERLDKNRFMQNLLLDQFLSVDIYNKAKNLNIPLEVHRVVLLVEPKKEGDSIVMETLKGLYATSPKDVITAIDEHHIIFVKTLETTEGYEEIRQTALTIADTLSAEAMIQVRVSYGTIVDDLKEVSKSYKEAIMALNVGRIFYVERNVLAYSELGIGRLIHQIPASLCEMFLKEVLAGKDINQFDEETLMAVHKFFDNNLNVSETARQLYVHRNTLVYRLEKIQKQTGLDVRIFEDALTFKIALMVTKQIHFLQFEESSEREKKR
ncbi:MAG: helix-turn-helix domain-containing protein [Lachnospiraceae bacterium]